MKIAIIVNGDSLAVPEQWTVEELVAKVVAERGPVAVELNRQILKQQDWCRYRLRDADRLEIVHFVGGG